MTLDTIGSLSDSSDKGSSLCAGSSNGSPQNAMRKAACRRRSGMASMIGGLITLAYAIYRQDPVFIAGQSIGSVVYLRNLMLIHRPNQGASDTASRRPNRNGTTDERRAPPLQTPAPIDRSIQPLALVLLLAMAAVLFFVGLGSLGLTDRDEGRNAEAGREMYETGNYISPTFNYEPRFAKAGLCVLADDRLLPPVRCQRIAARFPQPSSVWG